MRRSWRRVIIGSNSTAVVDPGHLLTAPVGRYVTDLRLLLDTRGRASTAAAEGMVVWGVGRVWTPGRNRGRVVCGLTEGNPVCVSCLLYSLEA